ncbi:hypothetical protein H3V53_07580 [Paraburkholderia bengalensis]|uniref:Amino acid permease/ SLC12A domain-containing protein n=1 Tax=Paraburkholderia bengalensis TaxID=2747562 RepID=A0ABU8IN89_9BURK
MFAGIGKIVDKTVTQRSSTSLSASSSIVGALILMAVRSCLNSALYTVSRMLFSIGSRERAPKVVARTCRASIPSVRNLIDRGRACRVCG